MENIYILGKVGRRLQIIHAHRRELISSLFISHCFNKKFASSLLFLVSWSTEQVEVESTDLFS